MQRRGMNARIGLTPLPFSPSYTGHKLRVLKQSLFQSRYQECLASEEEDQS